MLSLFKDFCLNDNKVCKLCPLISLHLNKNLDSYNFILHRNVEIVVESDQKCKNNLIFFLNS